jgi:phage shock protein E
MTRMKITKRPGANPQKKRGLPVWTRWAALGVLIVAAGLVIVFVRNRPVQLVPNDALYLYQQGAYFLDVRSAQEFDRYRVPDVKGNPVHNIPYAELPSRLDEIPKDQDVIIIGETTPMGEKALTLLRKNGYTRVAFVTGGMSIWIETGLPVQGMFPK